MADEASEHAERRRQADQVDTSRPSVARAWNYLAGGRDNFEADRRAVREVLAVAPVMSAVGPAARAFQRRVVAFLAAQAGIRQFLDIGPGMPMPGSTHEVARAIAPDSRVVYADIDPVVIAHARALLAATRPGRTACLEVDARDTVRVIAGAASCLDLTRPAAVIMMGLLPAIAPLDSARAVVRDLARALPPGSYVAIRHAASDLDPSILAGARAWNRACPSAPLVPRSRHEVASLVDGLEPVAPGLVPVNRWRPDGQGGDLTAPLYGVVARRP
ncbi:MAG TPA: SAM-dependent methyltransferase [Trebonia sp.]|nr:SAM-dependent methyltransferase [Trebonia sp.]